MTAICVWIGSDVFDFPDSVHKTMLSVQSHFQPKSKVAKLPALHVNVKASLQPECIQ